MICGKCKRQFDEYETRERVFSNNTKHTEGLCPFCKKHQRFLPREEYATLYFGKYRGERISDVVKKDRGYLEWLIDNYSSEGLKKKIKKELNK